MKHSFSVILTMCILMIIGIALIPRLDISNKPRPRQGKTLNVSYSWSGASAKVIEQNVTSRIEGLCASVNGVESVSSESYFGSGHVSIQLKKQASVSAVKFEIASLIRQIYGKLPKGVSYPDVSGGEVITSKSEKSQTRQILSYTINGNKSDNEIRKIIESELKPKLERIDGVGRVDVQGGTWKYMEISYDARTLSLYGITAYDIEEAIRVFMGRNVIIGDVMHTDENGERSRISLFLAEEGKSLETIPIKSIDGKIVYLNNLARCELKDHKPSSYYRINGQSTIYLNVFAEPDVNINTVSADVKALFGDDGHVKVNGTGLSDLHFNMVQDVAEDEYAEFRTLITRSAMSLVILLLFVYLSRRSIKYFSIITITLLANILMAVICYCVFDIRLHPFSMAGITVSFGLIIDSTIVMVDHYSYHKDYKAFYGILGAMLTTIGSLIIIFWLPEALKKELYDFSWMIIINLGIAILVSALFAPALVSRMKYECRQTGHIRNYRFVHAWGSFYNGYLRIVQHRIWRWPMLILVTGVFAWSLYLFIQTINTSDYHREKEPPTLHIRGQMPLGGSVQELNEKVRTIEAFLTKFKEIKRFDANLSQWGGASITIEFKPEYQKTSFPYYLENKVIGKLITIGGADWSTYGVSERGFSNSLNLQYRSNSIEIAGYDYDRLYRFAEDMCRIMSKNPRVQDLCIQTPGHEEQEEELYMEYDYEMLANDSVRIGDVHNALRSILSESNMGYCRNENVRKDIVLHSDNMDDFDLWQLENSFVKVGGRDIRVSDLMKIGRREAKNCIPRRNQEYVLRVAFNVLGSYTYTSKYVKGIMDKFDAKFPVGFRCVNRDYYWNQDEGQQYWLIGLVVVIIFFVCSIMFESLYQALVIILLIPFSMIGMFFTYHWGGVAFGTGGFAAMVMLCGLTVNAGIYLMNEYNNNGHRFVKAYNHKIIPIFLTVLSTVCGLIPFLIDGPEEEFWFSFAVGSISGLIFSIVALVFVLPMMMKRER
ncbi:MAG: efflux RND transporter permease subunit [Bacteroidaceae bacterium]|nr:efflux RND transporter permease subunit [Bacteroidaceae bacterium]